MKVHYHRRGQGTPLVLIHGVGHRWQAWEPVLDELACHHEIWAVDLPGFGASPVPAGGMPKDMAATVAGVGRAFSDLGIERPHVAGYSLGGAISLELAAAGLVSTATAFSPAGFFTDAERKRALRTLARLRLSTFAPRIMVSGVLRVPALRDLSLGPVVAYPARLSHERALADAMAMRNGKGFRTVARAARNYRFEGVPDCPVTVAWGERDQIFGVHQLNRVRYRLPGARTEVLAGCGHVPISDAPDLVTAVILTTTGAITPSV